MLSHGTKHSTFLARCSKYVDSGIWHLAAFFLFFNFHSFTLVYYCIFFMLVVILIYMNLGFEIEEVRGEETQLYFE